MTVPMVIYHGGCRDGWCAAWVAWRHGYEHAEFVLGVYGQKPPDVYGRDVLIVDFSYSRADLDAMARTSRSLRVLDHHKTAEAELTGVPYAEFDMNRSGAGMTWDALNPTAERPWIVDYIEDRDLWRHQLADSETVNAYLATLPFEFVAWDHVALHVTLPEARAMGRVARDKTRQYVAEVRKNARTVIFEGHPVPMVNAPQVDISELLDSMLSPNLQFVMGWWQRADGLYNYSLRSRGDFDVSVLAKKYGGGGHKNAAGFQLSEMLAL